MSIYKKHIFWVETYNEQEDWFTVGVDQYVAERYFADNMGYGIEQLYSEDICVAEFEDEEDRHEEAYFPSHEMLIKNGFEVISENEPSIFWRAGKKFCQGNIIKSVLVAIGNKQSGVYIVEVRDSGLFKIGVTKDIVKRLHQLQTSNPYEFYLKEFFVTPNNRELESLLHKKFRLFRYKREWFKLSDEQVSEACHFARNFTGKPYIQELPEDIERMRKEYEAMFEKYKDSDLPF